MRRSTRSWSPSSSARTERRAPLADPGRPVEEVRVRRPSRRAPRAGGASPRAAQKRSRSRPRITSAISSGRERRRRRVDDPVREQLGQLAVGARRPSAGARRPRARAGRCRRPRRRRLAGRASRRKVRSGRSPSVAVQVELEHAVDAEAARDALVGEGRVDVAVGDHVAPRVERGPDHLPRRARRARRRRGPPRPRALISRPSRRARAPFAERRAARLARRDDLAALAARGAPRGAPPGSSSATRRCLRR